MIPQGKKGGQSDPIVQRGIKAEVRLDLPELQFYVSDSTAPTIGLYLCPDRESVELLKALELDVDSRARPRPWKYLLYGAHWLESLDSEFVGAELSATSQDLLRSDWPATVEGDSIDGFFVRRGVRVEILPLTRTDPECQQQGDEEEIKAGISYYLRRNDEMLPIGRYHVFDQSNIPSGDDLTIVVEARDQAGNERVVEVPVYVVPTGFHSKALSTGATTMKSLGAGPPPPDSN